MNVTNDQNSLELKKSILIILIGLSKSDTEIQGKELLFILDAGKSFGFSEQETRNLLYEDFTNFTSPTQEQERMNIIYLLLFLSKQDGTLNEAEENYIYHFGFKLGFNESMLRDMVKLFKDKHTQNIEPKELIDIIRKYLN